MIPVVRHAPLSEPHYETTYNIYPSIQQDLNRTRYPSQNQTQTFTLDRQIIHPRQKINFTKPRVQFNMPSSPSPNPLYHSSNTIQSTSPPLQTISQQSTPNKPSDYLGSIPTCEKVCENSFNPPISTQRIRHCMTQSFTQGEPNLVNDPLYISSDTCLALPETLSLSLTPSTTKQIPTTPFPLNFPTNLDDRYREILSNKIPLKLDWKTFAVRPPLCDEHRLSHILQNWAPNR